MEQYIKKSTLVIEIKKLKGKVSDNSSYCNGWQHALRMLELSIDTLEVKEVEWTEEDMKLIWTIGDELPYMSEEEFYKELLKRYKAHKGE